MDEFLKLGIAEYTALIVLRTLAGFAWIRETSKPLEHCEKKAKEKKTKQDETRKLQYESCRAIRQNCRALGFLETCNRSGRTSEHEDQNLLFNMHNLECALTGKGHSAPKKFELRNEASIHEGKTFL